MSTDSPPTNTARGQGGHSGQGGQGHGGQGQGGQGQGVQGQGGQGQGEQGQGGASSSISRTFLELRSSSHLESQ